MKRDAVELASDLVDSHQPDEAFRLLLKAGQRGEGRVFINLGCAYDVGLGVRKSKAKALRWYRRALGTEGGTAAHNIATVYRDRGDVIRAVRWLRRAIALGESGSNLELGKLLLSHFGAVEEALACFKAVGPEECEADIEAADTWAATAEGLIRARAAEQPDAADGASRRPRR